MKFRIIAKVACRLMAIYFLVLSLNNIINLIINLVINLNGLSGNILGNLPWIASSVLMSLTAVLLWIYADKISTAVTNEIEESTDGFKENYDKIAAVAFTVIGLFVLARAIPDTVRMIIQHNLLLSSQLNYKETSMYADSLSRIIGEFVRIGIGIWLTFGANGIYNMIKGIRGLGTDRIES